MKGENSIELLIMESNSYTCVSPITLDPMFPDEELSSDDVVRELPSIPLRERSPEEIARLINHPLFTENA
jgi:hypothetical protein